MFRKFVISLLFLASFLAVASSDTSGEKREHQRISRLRNRPGLYEVDGLNTSHERPQGLLDSSGFVMDRQLPVATPNSQTTGRTLKEKGKGTGTKESKKTRQAEMSMSMDLRQFDFSLSMELRQFSLSMATRQMSMSM